MARMANVTSTEGKILISSLGDGGTHINIYSHGNTDIGRRLSNFSRNPFTHPVFGEFQSMEGYWYWLATGMQHHILKTKYGYDAKAYGRTRERVKNDQFENWIIEGLHCMLRDNPKVYEALLNTKLPLTHYYSYANTLKDNPSSLFMLTEFDLIRNGKPLMFP